MFYGRSSLNSFNLENLRTEKVEDLSNMFYKCSSLTSINLNKFNTKNVEFFDYMFYGCLSLKYINIEQFITNQTKIYLFSGLPQEGHIIINKEYKNCSDKFEKIPEL